MQGEKIKTTFMLTIMGLVIFGGINITASVLNLWMSKTIAPQLITFEKKPNGLQLEILGTQINWQEHYHKEFIESGKDSLGQLYNRFKVFSKFVIKEFEAYGDDMQGKIFFKDR